MNADEMLRLYDQGQKDFSQVNLSREDIIQANLTQIDFTRADLNWANLSGSDFSGANFSRADLTHTRMISAKLIGVNLTNADLSYADLSWVNLNGANLSNVDLSHGNLSKSSLANTNFKHIKKPVQDIIKSELPKDIDLLAVDTNLSATQSVKESLRIAAFYPKSLKEIFLTIKLPIPKLIPQLENHKRAMRKLGFKVQYLQLPSHHREVLLYGKRVNNE
ncbi:MAG: pentapeptide repeat-containing protein [Cyanobacteria bacterium]|nr:pentapeptide repeat-containing protein [Cyanobacteria bacterium CG_2015-02_32_10]